MPRDAPVISISNGLYSFSRSVGGAVVMYRCWTWGQTETFQRFSCHGLHCGIARRIS